MKKVLVSPSILACDFGNINQEIIKLNNSSADWIHFDVMDGHFVPNISFGFPVLDAVNKIATKPLDVHLMIENPELYVDNFIKAGAKILTIHQEASIHLNRLVNHIKSQGVMCGVALNPSTSILTLEDIIEDVDMVLLMTVNPGFGGQKFIAHSVDKVKRLKQMITSHNSKALIEVDGGVDNTNCKQLVDSGVDVLVAGSYVFKAQDIDQNISILKQN